MSFDMNYLTCAQKECWDKPWVPAYADGSENFCGGCGTRLELAPKCFCGKQFQPKLPGRFCEGCGKALAEVLVHD